MSFVVGRRNYFCFAFCPCRSFYTSGSKLGGGGLPRGRQTLRFLQHGTFLSKKMVRPKGQLLKGDVARIRLRITALYWVFTAQYICYFEVKCSILKDVLRRTFRSPVLTGEKEKLIECCCAVLPGSFLLFGAKHFCHLSVENHSGWLWRQCGFRGNFSYKRTEFRSFFKVVLLNEANSKSQMWTNHCVERSEIILSPLNALWRHNRNCAPACWPRSNIPAGAKFPTLSSTRADLVTS